MLRTLFGLNRPLRRFAEACAAAALGLLAPAFTALAQDVPEPAPLVLRNLALDGDFTNGGTATTSGIIAAPRKFGAWTVDLGNVGLHVNEFSTPGGVGNVVDLNGTRAGSIFQSIDTISSGRYTVSFLVSGNWSTNPDTPRSLSLRFGTEKVSRTLTRPAGWSKSNPQWQVFSADFLGTGLKTGLRLSSDDAGIPDGALITAIEIRGPVQIPGPLSSVPVPRPQNLADFVQDQEKAIALGKALFWDMQVGGDGRTACASCHWHAGTDARTSNMLNPGAPGSAFGPQRPESAALGSKAVSNFRGPAKGLKATDFPFHRLANPLVPGNSVTNPVVSDTMEVVGSEGVIAQLFKGITEGSEVDKGEKRSNPVFEVGGTSLRQTTGRNSPTPINAVFLDRSFWDGRANRYFNGVNEFGDLDPDARVLKASANGSLLPVRILLDNATLASQAVGPVDSHVEMSWLGRSIPDVGRKMLSLRPLALQRIAADDSVLAAYRDHSGKGLDAVTSGYASLIRSAFRPEWWSGTQITADGYTHMEANFSLFWGLSVMLYEATLISDKTPFDAFAAGNEAALSPQARAGLSIFMNEGRCIDCHAGSEFAGATISHVRPIMPDREGSVIEFMPTPKGPSFYDKGFYNIGVRQTLEDLGVGAAHPVFGPLSYTRQDQRGRNRDSKFNITPQARVTVDGAFKSPSLRNIELTGPYMHNGGMKSLTEVMEFYARGADFFHANIQDLSPGVQGIPILQNNPEGIAAVVEFLKHLTDERVRIQAAPFDHPELLLPDGPAEVTTLAALDRVIVFPATGRSGGAPIEDFESVLRNGLKYEAPVSEAPVADPVMEEETAVEEGGDAGTPGSGNPNQEPISLPTPDADDVPENKKHLIDRDVKPPREEAHEEGGEEEAHEEEPVVEEEPAEEEEAAEEPAEEEEAAEEEEMTEEPAEEEVVEEEVVEEPVVEEPEAEEPAHGEEGDHSNREPISLPTPDADDVPENKKHLIDRNVKPPREEAPEEGGEEEAHEEAPLFDEEPVVEEETVVEEEAAEEPVEVEEPAVEEAADLDAGSSKQHLLGRKVKPPRTAPSEPAMGEALPEARLMEGAEVMDVDVAPIGEELEEETVTFIAESEVVGADVESAKPELVQEPEVFMPHDVWVCVLPTPFSMGILGFPVDENGDPIIRRANPADAAGAEPAIADGELVTVTDIPVVDPKGILVGRTLKAAPAPADPDQPSPKGILLQRKTKPAPATAE